MRIWFTSRNVAITLSIFIAVGTSLILLNAIANQGLSARTVAASLLILSFVLFGVGCVLYIGRAFLKWQIEENSSHLIWERGFVIVAVLATALGLVLLEDLLHDTRETVLARLGMVAYLFGAVIVVVAETSYLGRQDWVYPQIVVYVVLAFLAQSAFGAALLQTELVAGWVAWVTIIWNLAWLMILPIVHPRDIYFPVLHHVAPLIIGIALLAG